ncbi:LCP family protein [Schinkia azotoformans]|uniref:Transcriptional regulator n=1 Tax=Schinkia azotoformans LMG 9581 TaxID=1131731 RepID=K6DKA2_SCHAZ|nr:LCP family protein [Schinkia azotoformans]EKN68558.1 transcriptional regulator [Schinkia azotoformans LMG 9581]MEC1637583.1 LCP family protein [Schinkia azotoformans]MEC1718841.1 LCP family protein [Schinkia azotoformans]MEC1943987.1 LCP family protein [Schinkia azotoformans]MED4412947.1 LCP family protein [Schinkia azotoformans]
MARFKKRRKVTKILMIILIPLLVVFVGAAAYASYLASTAKTVVESSQHKLDSRKFDEKSEMRLEKVDPRVDNISILFLGIDDGEHTFSDSTRTDAMILATFNEKSKSVKMVSIPRDSRVELVGRGRMDKITHAHAYGGLDMAVNTVEKLFAIPVDYYVRLNFDAFIKIIDALGGIEIDVPFDIVEQNSHREKNKIKINKGLQKLNGEQALAYARTRKYDGDVERGQRQQEILKAIIKKGLSIRSMTKYGDVIESIGDNLTTNMTFDEMLAFHDYAYAGKNIDVEMLTLKGKPARINRLYYYLLDDTSLDEVKTKMKQHLEFDGTDANDRGKTERSTDDNGE